MVLPNLMVPVNQLRNIPLQAEKFHSIEQVLSRDGCILTIGGMNLMNFGREDGRNVLVLNLKTNEWIEFVNLPEPRHHHSAECLDNNLYVIGGCNPQETIEQNRFVAKRTCFKLNLKKSKWSKLPQMKCARYDHGSVIYNKQIYVFGGQDENGRLLKSVEIYDPKRNDWKMNPPLCCGRKAAGVAVYNDRIWIVGGLIETEKPGEFKSISHVDLYDPREKKWQFNMYCLPTARCYCNLAVWINKLYCIGGMVGTGVDNSRSTNEVLFVEHENELWKVGPDLPEPRIGGVAVIHGANLYFLGGYDPDSNSNAQNVFFLTPGATSWNIETSLSCHLHGMCAVSFEDK